MKILAHRGWWQTPEEKNSETAFRRAFENGFGVETDVRDQDGTLRISHDMPVGDRIMTMTEFFDIYSAYPQAGDIALNIKADGLQSKLKQEPGVDRHSSKLFCFDMAVPDAIGYKRHNFTTYTRHSEIEPEPAFYEMADGVWVDCFYGDWIKPEIIQSHLDRGKKVALVSPELHGRPYAEAWRMWSEVRGSNVSICTDLPHLAAEKWL